MPNAPKLAKKYHSQVASKNGSPKNPSPNNGSLDNVEIKARNVVQKFGFASRAGGYPQKKSIKKNQDMFILEPNISKSRAMHCFGVADGHGKNG
jgi:hypothetical protein